MLTRESNRPTIEPWIEEHSEYRGIHFLYFDLPKWARFWKKGLRGVRTYYNITDFIGKNSIVLYFLSGAIPNTIATLINRFLNGNELFIATFTLSIIISYIITLVICDYFPFLTDIRKTNIKSIR